MKSIKIALILFVSLVQINSSLLLAVVHLNGKYSSIQVVGGLSFPPLFSSTSITDEDSSESASMQIQAGAFNETAPNVAQTQPSTGVCAAQHRIKKLEKLVERLTATLEEAEKIRQEAEKKRLEELEVKRQKERNNAPLEGIVCVSNEERVDVRFGSQPLLLSLEGNGRLICSEPVAFLKASDVLSVRGKRNELIVSGELRVEGAIVFAEEDAQLSINLMPGASLYLSPASGRVELSPGATLMCRGAGNLVFGRDITVAFDNKPSGASFILSEGIHACLAAASVKCSGVGAVVLDNGTTFTLDASQQCLIGLYPEDNIDLCIQNRSEMTLAANDHTGLFFHMGVYNLVLRNKASLRVGAGAVLALHDHQVSQVAVCRKLEIGAESFINFEKNAIFMLSEQGEECSLSLVDKAIRGDGIIDYKGFPERMHFGQGGSMEGRCSIDTLTRFLAHKTSAFRWASLFEGISGGTWLFLPSENADQGLNAGKFIKLERNEVITGEDPSLRKVWGVFQGHLIEIDGNGGVSMVPRTRGSLWATHENEFIELRAFFVDWGRDI